MNRLVLPVTTAVVCFTLASCGKSSNKQQLPPNVDQRLAGYWKLSPPPAGGGGGGNASPENVVAPRIIKLQINRNGVRQADYCDLPAKGQGMGEYSVDSDVLSVKYFAAKASGDSGEPLTFNENKFSGKITRLESDTLELDGKLKYVRFQPAKGEALDDNTEGLCK